jgi:L-serine dehydratase
VTLSVLDMFRVGVGPSSSHTVGPMRAARRFAEVLLAHPDLARAASLRVELFGSLGATGKGHGSDVAVVVGLEGALPETVDTDTLRARFEAVRTAASLRSSATAP